MILAQIIETTTEIVESANTPAIINTTVGQLTESTINLAEAAANFGALKVMFGIFLVFTMVIFIYFVYQMIGYNKKIFEVYQTSKNIEKFMGESSNRMIGVAEANVLIRRAFASLAQAIKYSILRIRLEQHNKTVNSQDIQLHVRRLVEYEYAELKSFLSNFTSSSKQELETLISLEDSQLVIEFMLEQINQDKQLFSVASMDQATDILLNGLKLVTLKKLV